MKYYIRMPEGTVERNNLCSLINSLENYYGLATYEAVVIVVSEEDAEKFNAMLRDLAEHVEGNTLLQPAPKSKAKANANGEACTRCGRKDLRVNRYGLCQSCMMKEVWDKKKGNGSQNPEAGNPGLTVIVESEHNPAHMVRSGRLKGSKVG
jgi:hypothetical protein